MTDESMTTEYGGYDQVLGLELQDMSGDRVTGRLEVKPHLHQPYGIVHGGVFCSVVETVASVGGAVWFGDRGHVVGVSNHTNFLRAVREGVLAIEGTPVHRGRTQQLWSVDVRDEQGKLIAKGELRVANLPAQESTGT